MQFGRRQFLRTVGVGAGAIALHACGGGDDDQSAGTGGGTTDPSNTDAASGTTAPEDSTGTTAVDAGYVPTGTLDVWVHESEPSISILTEQFAAYMSEHPDVTINMLSIPYGDFETKSLTSTSAGEGPGLVKLPGWSLPDWADKELLVPLAPELVGFTDKSQLEAAFAPTTLGAVSFEERPYALPFDYQNLMLFYNKSHFEEVGLDPESPPTTWEQVVEMGEGLSVRNGDVLERAGFEWWYTTPIWVYLELQSLIAQLGGSILSEDGTEGNLASPEGLQAVEYYLAISTEYQIGSMELIVGNVLDAMADGTASMLVSGAFTGPALSARTEGALAEESGTLGVATMPTWADATNDVTAAYSWGWGITSNADDPRLAGDVARYLTEAPQSNQMFSEAGVGSPYAGFGTDEVVRSTLANRVMIEQIPNSSYGPRTPQFVAMMTELAQQIQQGAVGDKSAQQVAEDFDAAMSRRLRR